MVRVSQGTPSQNSTPGGLAASRKSHVANSIRDSRKNHLGQPTVETNRGNETLRPELAPWKVDEKHLEVRLAELESLPFDNHRESQDESKRRLPWPHGSYDFDQARGVDASFFAQDPDDRCRRLARPPPPPLGDTARPPIAVLLTGQLRTAEVCVAFLEENVIRASAPSEVHVFAHVWSLLGKRNNFSEKVNPDGGHRDAAAQGEARLRRVPGLKAFVVEPEEGYSRIVCNFYEERYGHGWCKRRRWPIADLSFFSQW